MHLTADSKNNIITGSNNVKVYGFDKMYMDKELIEDKFHQIIDQVNERKITSAKFYSILFNRKHLFYDGNGRMCKTVYQLVMMI